MNNTIKRPRIDPEQVRTYGPKPSVEPEKIHALVMQGKTDREISELLSVSSRYVVKRRLKLGLPPAPGGRVNGGLLGSQTKLARRRYSIDQIRLLAQIGLRDLDIASRLGTSRQNICNLRRRHDIPAGVPAGSAGGAFMIARSLEMTRAAESFGLPPWCRYRHIQILLSLVTGPKPFPEIKADVGAKTKNHSKCFGLNELKNAGLIVSPIRPTRNRSAVYMLTAKAYDLLSNAPQGVPDVSSPEISIPNELPEAPASTSRARRASGKRAGHAR